MSLNPDDYTDAKYHDPAHPFCIGCGTFADGFEEYIEAARENDFIDANAYVRCEEGTYNCENGHFLCTPCYVKAGMPSGPRGWTAP